MRTYPPCWVFKAQFNKSIKVQQNFFFLIATLRICKNTIYLETKKTFTADQFPQHFSVKIRKVEIVQHSHFRFVFKKKNTFFSKSTDTASDVGLHQKTHS